VPTLWRLTTRTRCFGLPSIRQTQPRKRVPAIRLPSRIGSTSTCQVPFLASSCSSLRDYPAWRITINGGSVSARPYRKDGLDRPADQQWCFEGRHCIRSHARPDRGLDDQRAFRRPTTLYLVEARTDTIPERVPPSRGIAPSCNSTLRNLRPRTEALPPAGASRSVHPRIRHSPANSSVNRPDVGNRMRQR